MSGLHHQLQGRRRERVRQIEHEALHKLRRLDGERLFAYHQEL